MTVEEEIDSLIIQNQFINENFSTQSTLVLDDITVLKKQNIYDASDIFSSAEYGFNCF